MRHTHYTTYKGRPVVIAMGFDVQLSGYFMVVEPVEDDNPDADEETGMIYSNLDDADLKKSKGFSDDLAIYKRRLREMKIEVPKLFP